MLRQDGAVPFRPRMRGWRAQRKQEEERLDVPLTDAWVEGEEMQLHEMTITFRMQVHGWRKNCYSD